jgi:AcrR family transcriptional regulator
MARVKALDFEDKQKQILRQAAILFAKKGYRQTSLDDIAAACGAKKSSLYHYHGSKHAILFGVVSGKITELVRKVEEAVEAAETPRERLRAVVATLVSEYIRVPYEVTVLLTQAQFLNKAASKSVSDLQHRFINRAVLIFTQLRPDLNARRDTLTSLAMLLFGMTNWIHVWYDPKGPIKPEELTDLITDIFLDGYLNKSSKELR